MKQPYPTIAITVEEIIAVFKLKPLDCTKNSHQIKAELEEHFGYRIRVAALVLACLWQGFAIVPHDRGRTFTFCKVEA